MNATLHNASVVAVSGVGVRLSRYVHQAALNTHALIASLVSPTSIMPHTLGTFPDRPDPPELPRVLIITGLMFGFNPTVISASSNR
jgi:hypothetical protein